MSKQTEEFAKWRESLSPALGSDFNQLDQEALYLIELAWQASRTAALEAAIEACRNEHLEDLTFHAADIAYDCAIEDCVAAIRALKEQYKEDERTENWHQLPEI